MTHQLTAHAPRPVESPEFIHSPQLTKILIASIPHIQSQKVKMAEKKGMDNMQGKNNGGCSPEILESFWSRVRVTGMVRREDALESGVAND